MVEFDDMLLTFSCALLAYDTCRLLLCYLIILLAHSYTNNNTWNKPVFVVGLSFISRLHYY